MRVLKVVFFISTVALISCGPSVEEEAMQEKRKADSIIKATEIRVLREKARQDSITVAEKMAIQQRESLKQELLILKAKLAGEETKLKGIEEFTFLRTDSEKAEQVAQQTFVIEQLKQKIVDIEIKLR